MCMKARQILLLAFLKVLDISTSKAEEIFKECEYVAHGNFVALTDAMQEHNCIAYIYCNGVDSFTDVCPIGTYFDAASQECILDEEGRCQYPTMSTTSTPTLIISNNQNTTRTTMDSLSTLDISSTLTTYATFTSSMPSSSLSGRPKCTIADADNYFPHAQRCEYYYKCIGSGYLTIMRCNTDYFWDYKRQQCMPAKKANCFSHSEQRVYKLSN